MNETISVILTLILGGFSIVLLHGAWLLVEDSEKQHKERKRVAKQYPELTRGQVRAIAKLNLEKFDDTDRTF